jgi:segregation and condensation protein A
MPVQDDYKVQLEVFEGPLDLLLYLIKKNEVDIYNIPIERITTQYMDYLNVMKMLDLTIAGEFIVMAATLMMIKSRMLLPVEERPELEVEEDDPRWELVRQLVEYKKFKDAATLLQDRAFCQENIFALGAQNIMLNPEDESLVLQDISLFDLISAFREILSKARPEELSEISAHQFTVSDKITYVLGMVHRDRSVAFSNLFRPDAVKAEVICTFLAILELIRLRQIGISQDRHFDEIMIVGVDSLEDPSPWDQAPAEPEQLQDGAVDHKPAEVQETDPAAKPADELNETPAEPKTDNSPENVPEDGRQEKDGKDGNVTNE